MDNLKTCKRDFYKKFRGDRTDFNINKVRSMLKIEWDCLIKKSKKLFSEIGSQSKKVLLACLKNVLYFLF